MILNALDEVLFWGDISLLKSFICENTLKYYPHSPEEYYIEKNKFLEKHIPDQNTFISKLELYAENGSAIWVSGRNQLSDDNENA